MLVLSVRVLFLFSFFLFLIKGDIKMPTCRRLWLDMKYVARNCSCHLQIIFFMLDLNVLVQGAFKSIALWTCGNRAFVEPRNVLSATSVSFLPLVVYFERHIQLVFVHFLVFLYQLKTFFFCFYNHWNKVQNLILREIFAPKFKTISEIGYLSTSANIQAMKAIKRFEIVWDGLEYVVTVYTYLDDSESSWEIFLMMQNYMQSICQYQVAIVLLYKFFVID